MSDKCCPRADVVSTHWEGCHTIHPECAAWRAGREAGMREAAKVAEGHGGGVITKALAVDIRDAILAAIGEKHD